MLAQQAFSISFPLMWEWEECDSFDVASGSTQIMPSRHALKFVWGGHYYMECCEWHKNAHEILNTITIEQYYA